MKVNPPDLTRNNVSEGKFSNTRSRPKIAPNVNYCFLDLDASAEKIA